MKRVLLYIRVSTTRQDLEGYSIPMQKERLFAYCKAKGWVVVGVFVDPGFSGASLDRPGMASLIEAVEAKKGDAVLVYKLDRLSRSQRDVLYLLDEVFEPNGIAFVSMQESFDTSTVFGKAVMGILSVFSQMERATISERTMMGRVGRTEKGLWRGGGDWPIGYDYVDGELVVNEPEAEQVRMVYGMYADGISVTEITRRMEGYTTKHGDWSHTSTVSNVLDNPLYAGTVHFDGVRAKGKHTAIVDPDTDRIVKYRRDRLRHAENHGIDSDYLLTGLIFCSRCGARYFANRRPSGQVVYSCHSRAKKNKKMVKDASCKAPHYPMTELDARVESELLYYAEDLSRVDQAIKKRAARGGDSLADRHAEELGRIDTEINKLMDLYQHSDLASVEEIADRIAKLHAERVKLSPKIEVGGKGFDVEGSKVILRDVRHGWRGLDIRGRRALLLQLIDRIHVDAGGIDIDWSFLEF